MFKYYIIDVYTANVVGTNDFSIAMEFAAVEDNFVIDSSEGAWLFPDGSGEKIKDAKE